MLAKLRYSISCDSAYLAILVFFLNKYQIDFLASWGKKCSWQESEIGISLIGIALNLNGLKTGALISPSLRAPRHR